MSEFVSNDVKITLSETETPSIVVNGIEIAGAILPGFSLVNDPEARETRLTVTFPVSMQ